MTDTQEHNSKMYESILFMLLWKSNHLQNVPPQELDSTSPEQTGTLAPSRDEPLVLMGVWRVCVSPSPSSGEAKRCVSISAEKRRRAPGGLESDSVKDDSEHDKRFLERAERTEGVSEDYVSLTIIVIDN